LSSNVLDKSFNTNLNAPISVFEGGPHMGSSQSWWDSEGFSGKLLCYSLKQPRETKIKINEKSCQILVDTRGYRGDPGKTGRSQRKVGIHTRVSSPEPPSVMPSRNILVLDPFFLRDSYCLLACLVLCPKNLAWFSA